MYEPFFLDDICHIPYFNSPIASSPSYSHLIARLRGADLAGDEHGVYDGI
jgi:hypothetical protein